VGSASTALLGLLSGELIGLDLGSGELSVAGETEGGVITGAWSPDGRTLALGGPRGASLWEPGGEAVRLPQSGWCAAVRWADADRVAVADGRRAHVLSRSGELLWSTPEVGSTVTELLWIRSGRELGLAAYGGISFFSRGRTSPARVLPYQGSLLSVASTSDGSWIASGNQDASIHVWRSFGSDELEMGGFPFKVGHVAFDRSGRWLAATGAPEVTVWDFAGSGPAGTRPRMLSGHDNGATVLAWHQQGTRLAAGGEARATVWDAAAGRPGDVREPWLTVPVDGSVSALAWSGDRLLVASDRAELSVVEVAQA
jgi:WD40 repeat protein